MAFCLMRMLRSPFWRCFLFFIACLAIASGRVYGQPAGVTRELYAGIQGSTIPELTNAPSFPGRPDAVFLESAFEAPVNFSDNYGQRMRALLVPPATGSYVFYIASDDNSVLYLSTDATPANKTVIAYEASWAGPRAWNTH